MLAQWRDAPVQLWGQYGWPPAWSAVPWEDLGAIIPAGWQLRLRWDGGGLVRLSLLAEPPVDADGMRVIWAEWDVWVKNDPNNDGERFSPQVVLYNLKLLVLDRLTLCLRRWWGLLERATENAERD